MEKDIEIGYCDECCAPKPVTMLIDGLCYRCFDDYEKAYGDEMYPGYGFEVSNDDD